MLATVAVAIWVYWKKVPASIDTGLTVALRSMAHASTFDAVERARADLERAAITDGLRSNASTLESDAEARLEAYLASQASVQPDRLHTQAIVAATELLATIYADDGTAPPGPTTVRAPGRRGSR